MHTNGNGEVAFWRICGGGVPHFGRVEIKVASKYYYYYYYKQKVACLGGGCPHRGCK